MSDRKLRLQVILNALDNITRPFQSMREANSQLASAVKNTKDQLKALDKQSSHLDQFKKLSEKSRQTAADIDAMRVKTEKLASQLKSTENPTNKQNQALAKQRAELTKLTGKQSEEISKLNQLRGELYRSGLSAKDGASSTQKIANETARYNKILSEQEQRLRASTEQQKRLDDAKSKYDKTLELRNKIAGIGAKTVATGAAIGAPVVLSLKSYSNVEDAMKGVAKQIDGLLDDNGTRTDRYHQISSDLKDLAETLPTENGVIDLMSLAEGGGRMGILNKDDPWEKQRANLLKFVEVSAMASQAFSLPADELAQDMGKIAGIYKIPIGEIQTLGDTLNYLDNNSKATATQLFEFLKRAGGTAEQFGLENTAALGTAFIELGKESATAATAAKAMYSRLASASSQGKKFLTGLDMLGLNEFEIQGDVTNDALGTIKKVLAASNKLPKEKQSMVLGWLFGESFGTDAALLAGNLDRLTELQDMAKSSDAVGSMQLESNINSDSLSAQMALLKSSSANIFSDLGEALRDPLIEIFSYFKEVLTSIRKWIKQNPELTKTIMKVTAALAIGVTALGSIMLAIAALLGPIALLRLTLTTLGIKGFSAFGLLSVAIKKMGSVFLWLGRLFKLNPMLLAISLLVLAGYFLYENWDVISEKLAKAWDYITTTASEAWDEIVNYFAELGESLSEMGESISKELNELWVKMKTNASEAWDRIVKYFTDMGESISKQAKEIGEKIGKWFSQGIDNAMEKLRTFIGRVKWVLSKLGLINDEADGLNQKNCNDNNQQDFKPIKTSHFREGDYFNTVLNVHAAESQNEEDVAKQVVNLILKEQRKRGINAGSHGVLRDYDFAIEGHR